MIIHMLYIPCFFLKNGKLVIGRVISVCKMLLENDGWGRIMDMRVNERIDNRNSSRTKKVNTQKITW